MTRAEAVADIAARVQCDPCFIPELAKCVGMEDEIRTRPDLVADEITAYLDDLVENP